MHLVHDPAAGCCRTETGALTIEELHPQTVFQFPETPGHCGGIHIHGARRLQVAPGLHNSHKELPGFEFDMFRCAHRLSSMLNALS